MGWTSFFLNPYIAGIGGAMIASPIIIHLINRMRFKRVRFAAMEFLLEAQQRNRRRLLMEQLLLLLLRILIVLALAALIARLVLDSRLSVFGGDGKTHHLVLLDDTVSMQNRWGETSAFEEAKEVVRKLAREGAGRGTQTFSMILLSNPDAYFVQEEDVSDRLVTSLEDKLDTLECTNRTRDLVAGLEEAGKKLNAQKGVIKHLHVLSDYRAVDWEDNDSIKKTVADLADAEITVNLIRTVKEHLPNATLVDITGDLQSAAVDVPVRLMVTVRNDSLTRMENLRASIIVDGEKLPRALVIDSLEPDKSIEKPVDLVFHDAGLHRVQVTLPDDSLNADNVRFLSLDVPLRNNVLIVGNEIDGIAEELLQFALAPDPSLTGISPQIELAGYLRTQPLDRFRSIYILNQAELPQEAVLALEAYVRNGGGLVWFLGNQVKSDVYNRTLGKFSRNEEGNLARDGEALFPVPLADTRKQLTREGVADDAIDVTLKDHPMFARLQGGNSLLVKLVRLDSYLPPSDEWNKNDAERKDGVETLATVRDGGPLVFEHAFGRGRVVTFLTSAGPPWNNLEKTRLYVPLIQEIQLYIAKPDAIQRQREVGVPIELDFPSLDYADSIDFTSPAGTGNRLTEMIMERVKSKPADTPEADADTEGDPVSETPAADESDAGASNTDRLAAVFRGTDTPGIYSYRVKARLPTLPDNGAFAYNIASREGRLKIADDAILQRAIGGEVANVYVREFGDTSYIAQGVDPGSEVRKYLIYLLIGLLVAEQALAYRLSYHPEKAAAPAAA